MRSELVAEVPVVRYWVFAEMAWLASRPELGRVCRLARESGGRITASVIQLALPGLADVGAENVVRWCHHLRLCDPMGSLTGLGEDVADTAEVPVPEQGVYDVWAAAHPLLGSRMLHVERVTSARDGRHDEIQGIPVIPDRDVIFASVTDPRQRFVLRSFPANNDALGSIPRATRARCRVRWTLDWARGISEIRLDGEIDAGSRSIHSEPEHVAIDLWQVIANWAYGPLRPHGQWSTLTRRLAVPLTELSVAELEGFTKDLQIGDVEVPGFGTWNGVRLADVPIGPATADDASVWAIARLDRRLRDSDQRHTRGGVRRLFAEVTENTPLADLMPTLPEHDALLTRYASAPEIFWRLASPVDLAPIAIPEAELGAMTVGADPDPTEDQPVGGEAVFRVPYRGGWSMQMLVDQLTDRRALRRLLLVDRYVRGADNLRSLAMFVATLASYGAPAVDVWTGSNTKKEALTEIQGITGRPPRRYAEAFGSSGQPHDRYVILVPEHGDPFGWQLSNSPLDAHAENGAADRPGTPLRWRDLTGLRLSAEQLPQPMAAWVNGALS